MDLSANLNLNDQGAATGSLVGVGGGPGPDPPAPPRAGLQAKPIRRRNRMINSCLECRKRKLKCSKSSPTCTNCWKSNRDCLYIGPRLDEASQMRLAEIKEKQGTLERQLERDVAKSTTSKNTLQQRILADEVEDDYDEEREVEATPLVALDLTYDDDADCEDDMIDLGIQIGRMRITERIGGLSRPRLSEEISAGLAGAHNPLHFASQVQGFDDQLDGTSEPSLPEFLKPSDQYIVPTSGFFFGQIGDPPSFTSFLPTREAANLLITQYFIAVHPIAPCSHRPSLERTYNTFWEEIDHGYEPRGSVQAIIFAAMFSGLVSLPEQVVYEQLQYSKANWVNSLRMGTEAALSKANFLRTTKVETMQAFIIYMLPLCRAEVSRAHSVLVGAAVRMAECMGLHRDGEKVYGLSPLDTHVRRLVWHQLCFLDIRTCEAQGPKPVIRREDYDTKLPLNCNDEELTDAVVPPESSDTWTTNTLALIRFEINEMMRSIWSDRRKLESRRTSLTTVLTKIETFRRRMAEKYDHLLDTAEPLQRYARCVMYLLTCRLMVMVLHPYHANATNPMPPRLNNLLITSGIMVVELAIQLETNPLFREWSWYLGAYFQYQVALLLATEVYFRPHTKEADRIWSCLDFVFGLDRKLSCDVKSLQLLTEIQNRTAIYSKMRKVRGTSSTTRAVPSQNAIAGTSSPTGTPSVVMSQAPAALHGMGLMPSPLTHLPAQAQPQSQTLPQPHPQQHQPAHQPPHQPQPQMVFAGVSDGQALWTLPPNHGSPGGSDTSSVVTGQAAGHAQGMAGATGMGPGNIMDNIDWVRDIYPRLYYTAQVLAQQRSGWCADQHLQDTINTLFPNDPQTGGLSIQGFHDPQFNVFDWTTTAQQ
ncbi:hypothetical protein F4780DRAFT_383284 [Xylariomycetidae sp. FL0641]|nr:hypothetical protein F4780DRAFT_383284 [Xylariomycetidae sp. FL0641]